MKTMFGLSLSPDVCRKAHVFLTLFVFGCVYGCPTHIVLWSCFVFRRLVYPMLPVSPDCPFFFIASSVFSNVYLELKFHFLCYAYNDLEMSFHCVCCVYNDLELRFQCLCHVYNDLKLRFHCLWHATMNRIEIPLSVSCLQWFRIEIPLSDHVYLDFKLRFHLLFHVYNDIELRYSIACVMCTMILELRFHCLSMFTVNWNWDSTSCVMFILI
jgi:hypothetical protein